MDTWTCSACGAHNRAGATWCWRCYEPAAGATALPPPPEDAAPPRRPVWVALIAVIVVVSLSALFILRAFRDVQRFEVAATRGIAGDRPYAFVFRDAETGRPLRYNPCEPIHYVINPAGAPHRGVEDVHEAFRIASEATGLRFVYDGTTNEPAQRDRPLYMPDRYGERWAPVLVGWTNQPGVFDEHDAGAAGSGYVANSDGHLVYVSGGIILNPNEPLLPGFGPGGTWGRVLLHEIGHLLGLDHVSSPAEVMYPELKAGPGVYGPGDRQGLQKVGAAAGCLETPALP